MSLITREKDYETGMDEQAKQSAMSSLSDKVTQENRRDDRSSDYNETLRYERLERSASRQSTDDNLASAEREQALTERRNREQERAVLVANREYATHLSNLSRAELDAIQSKANTEVFTGFDNQALRGLIIAAVAEGLAQMQK
jgi:hypothetical protein